MLYEATEGYLSWIGAEVCEFQVPSTGLGPEIAC